MTTETPSSDAHVDDPTKPNLAGAVKMVKDRRTGETRPAKRAGRPRKGSKRAASPTSDASDSGERETPEVTEADIKGAGFLGAVVWKIVGGFTGNRPLNKDETGELGEALAPVLARWLPDMGAFAPEIALVVTVWGLYETTKVERPKGRRTTASVAQEDLEASSDPRMGTLEITLDTDDAE